MMKQLKPELETLEKNINTVTDMTDWRIAKAGGAVIK